MILIRPPYPLPATSNRSVDAAVYGSLCLVSSFASLAYAAEYRRHRSAGHFYNQFTVLFIYSQVQRAARH